LTIQCLIVYVARRPTKELMLSFISARQHIVYMLSALSPVRPPICLSVRLSHEWLTPRSITLNDLL